MDSADKRRIDRLVARSGLTAGEMAQLPGISPGGASAAIQREENPVLRFG
jgi:hypothetical protein